MSGAAAPVAGRRWSVTVSRACLGSGLCVATAPGRFRLAGGRSRPTAETAAGAEPDDAILAAAQLCPVGAIAVRDAETGQLVETL
ncbi:MAG TPA: ferredoxin [Polyangiaceae bacterium]|nr:ferredoxin [Polyangiaceae bacterium]